MKNESGEGEGILLLVLFVGAFIVLGGMMMAQGGEFGPKIVGWTDNVVGRAQSYLGSEPAARYALAESSFADKSAPNFSALIGSASALVPEGANGEETAQVVDAVTRARTGLADATLTEAEAYAVVNAEVELVKADIQFRQEQTRAMQIANDAAAFNQKVEMFSTIGPAILILVFIVFLVLLVASAMRRK